MTDTKLLTEMEVAVYYALSVRQLRTMRSECRGPRFLKISGRIGVTGGRVVYRRGDVEDWLESLPYGGANLEAARDRALA